MQRLSFRHMFGILFGLFAILFGATLLFAWTGPTATPPSSNTSAPINISASDQSKLGSLALGSASTPQAPLDVTGNILGDGLGITGNAVVSGSVTAGSFLYSSDRSLKHDIATIPNALNIVDQLRGVTFKWNSNDRPDVGVIAQEVEKVLPQVVNTNAATGLKSVEYGNLVGVLIEAVKQQQQEITALQARVTELEKAAN